MPAGCKPAYEAVQAWKTPFNEIVELYELTVESANPERGTASVTKRIITTPGSQIVDAEIKATPKDGYKFVKWSDGNTDNPRTVTVDRDVTFTAQFAEETVAVDDVISAIAVWGDRGMLCIETDDAAEATIYTVQGQMVQRVDLTAGINRIELPSALYIVKINGSVVKVSVR